MGIKQIIKDIRTLSIEELELLITVSNQVIELKKQIEE